MVALPSLLPYSPIPVFLLLLPSHPCYFPIPVAIIIDRGPHHCCCYVHQLWSCPSLSLCSSIVAQPVAAAILINHSLPVAASISTLKSMKFPGPFHHAIPTPLYFCAMLCNIRLFRPSSLLPLHAPIFYYKIRVLDCHACVLCCAIAHFIRLANHVSYIINRLLCASPSPPNCQSR